MDFDSVNPHHLTNPCLSRRIGESYGKSSDMFSLGLTILFTAIGKRNDKKGYWDVLEETANYLEQFSPDVNCFSDHFHSFLGGCLDVDPLSRESANFLLGSSFIEFAVLGMDSFLNVLVDQ